MENQKILLQKAIRLLAARPHSTAEIKDKLRQKNIGTDDDIIAVIERLNKLHYLDDQDFARIFINSSLRKKPQGLRMIKIKLSQKGITEEVFSAALKASITENQFSEEQMAIEASQKKLRTLHKLPYQKQIEKLYRFLLSRGFSQDAIHKAITFTKRHLDSKI